MATSGSSDFNLTRANIIQDALERVGGVRIGAIPRPEHVVSVGRTLDMMVKAWQAKGIRLWTVDEGTYTLSASSVVLGSDGNDYECIRSHTSSATDKPITGADYSSYWYKLGTSAGSAWVTATAYTTIARIDLDSDVIDIREGFVRDNGSDYPVTIMTREEYFNVMDKNPQDTSRPERVYFVRGRDNPYCIIDPYPDDSDDVIHLATVRKLEDFDSATDDADVTAKYLEALVTGLAYRISPKYGSPTNDKAQLLIDAREAEEIAMADDNETGDMKVSPYRGQ